MNDTNIAITVPHLFSPKSGLSAENNSYILALRFKFYGIFHINQSSHFISSITFAPLRVKIGSEYKDVDMDIYSFVDYFYKGLVILFAISVVIFFLQLCG